jgi:hypothetical protein
MAGVAMSRRASANKKRSRAQAVVSPGGIEEQQAELRKMGEAMLAAGDGDRLLNTFLELVGELRLDNARLTLRLAAAHRARFGRRSEKLTAEELGQLALALGASEEEAKAPSPVVPRPDVPIEEVDETAEAAPDTSADTADGKKGRKKPCHPGRTRLAPHLERKITPIPVPKEERICKSCGTEMVCIDHVEHERVEYVPAQIVVHVDRREKLACTACRQDVATADRPHVPVVLRRRRAGASLLAHLIEAKCDDALPIWRQRDQLLRLGFDVPANTLYSYWMYATGVIRPVAEAVLSTVLGEPIVGVDDTKLDVLDPAAGKNIRRGHLWCFVGTSPLVAFQFTESWCAEDIQPWISAIDGVIQCDDYKGYDAELNIDGASARLVPRERRLGCLMHVRRRFHAAFKGRDLRAAVPLGLIRDLYKVEEKAGDLAPADRLALRQAESLPLLKQFDDWVDDCKPRLLPQSPLGKAAGYALQQRPYIQRCFADGRFELDTGRVERQIRELAIGRKNYLFSGSTLAAQHLAAAYTLVQSCRRANIPVRDYLIDLFNTLEPGWPLERLAKLTPLRWAAARGLTDQLPEQAEE